jgi:hypothetical protein
MRRKEKKSFVRFQAELSPKDAAMVDSLRIQLDIHSNARLLTEAAAIVKWIVAERQAGRRIASFSGDSPVRELASAVIERSVLEPSLPRVELRWTPKQLERIHALLAAEPPEPTEILVKAISGQ